MLVRWCSSLRYRASLWASCQWYLHKLASWFWVDMQDSGLGGHTWRGGRTPLESVITLTPSVALQSFSIQRGSLSTSCWSIGVPLGVGFRCPNDASVVNLSSSAVVFNAACGMWASMLPSQVLVTRQTAMSLLAPECGDLRVGFCPFCTSWHGLIQDRPLVCETLCGWPGRFWDGTSRGRSRGYLCQCAAQV